MTDARNKNRVIIIGAGHNGLVCAAYLAKAGREVIVLEASDRVGGGAINEGYEAGLGSGVEVGEFSFSVSAARKVSSVGGAWAVMLTVFSSRQ